MSGDGNPLLDRSGLPDYALVSAEHVQPAMESVLASAAAALDALESDAPVTYDALMPQLEALGEGVSAPWGVVNHLMSVRNSPELREAHEAVMPSVVAFFTRLGQSQPIYKALVAIRQGVDWAELSPAQQRIVETEIRDFELGGVGLEGAQRERFNAIRQELSALATSFSNQVLDSGKAFQLLIEDADRLRGVGARVRGLLAANARAAGHEQASADEGPWLCTLDLPSYVPVLQQAEDRGLRAELHRAYTTRASSEEWDNGPIIRNVLALRQEAAQLLGYGSHAELSLATKMAPSVAVVEELLERLRSASAGPAVEDLEAVAALAAARGDLPEDGLKAWDLPFWTERLREERYALSDEELRPWFPLPAVLEGLFALAKRLFGVSVVAADGEAPIWQDDVSIYRIERDGRPLAAFYLDPYARPAEKRGGAWMSHAVDRSTHLPGGIQVDGLRLPVAILVCNQAPPSEGKPSLMGFREVETLFHEFGHGLQHMLTTVDDGPAAGINKVEWDAVELPSQFMENWCYHRETLSSCSRHVDHGGSLPEELFQRIVAARSFNAAGLMLRQLHFGLIDLELHHRWDGEEDPIAVDRRIASAVLPRPPEDYDRFLYAFSHIFAGGYSAGYFSYKWAEVLSADAFAAFEEAGLDDAEATAALGRRFRDTVLSLGGSQPAAEVFRSFRGRDPSPEPLLRHHGLVGN